jgi:hypothetical protein
MKFRLSRLEFVIKGMQDIRLLYRTWASLWTDEERRNNESVLVYVTVDDRLPGGEISLNFYATEEVLDKFLTILEKAGLEFSCEEFIPGLAKICRIECDHGGSGIIVPTGGYAPSGRRDS